jgi:hypothetical protein
LEFFNPHICVNQNEHYNRKLQQNVFYEPTGE